MSLKGAPELRAALRNLKVSFKPLGGKWADETARGYREAVPKGPTGRLSNSFRRRNQTLTKATVVGDFAAFFIDKGTKAHVEKPRRAKVLRWEQGGRVHFAKRVNHPATRARPFRQRIAEKALADNPPLVAVVEAWNAGLRGRGVASLGVGRND